MAPGCRCDCTRAGGKQDGSPSKASSPSARLSFLPPFAYFRENMPSHFKFKEYCPMVFRNLRERFGIDDQDFQARSGARFHTSYDKRYIIKTITSEDVAEMHNILKKYHQGSTVAREASDKEKAKELPTLKDNDFINEGQKIYIDDNNKKIFLEKLKKDVEFLAQLKLMDYSLLVGIHDVERAEQEEVECEENDGEEEGESDGTHPIGTPPDSPGNTLNSSPPLAPGEFDPNIDVYGIKCHENSPRKEVYFMAIIDILTHYDAKKKAAHAAKTVKHGGLSSLQLCPTHVSLLRKTRGDSKSEPWEASSKAVLHLLTSQSLGILNRRCRQHWDLVV
ncbi:phosphatidylinositol 5-phosphate 4-kinase type-2 alpha [Camelus ferus]|nr:phosphatidylinositol 5-phosphate 4-kinase type-2 alpha [Camelus ferus]